MISYFLFYTFVYAYNNYGGIVMDNRPIGMFDSGVVGSPFSSYG